MQLRIHFTPEKSIAVFRRTYLVSLTDVYMNMYTTVDPIVLRHPWERNIVFIRTVSSFEGSKYTLILLLEDSNSVLLTYFRVSC